MTAVVVTNKSPGTFSGHRDVIASVIFYSGAHVPLDTGGPVGAVGFDRVVRQTTATDARQRGFRYTDGGDGDALFWRCAERTGRVLFRK